MKVISFSNEHRRKHFEFFRKMSHPHFNICSRVDISSLLPALRANAYRFTPAIVYCISRTANEIPEFRQRIRENLVIEHELAHPSFTVLAEGAGVFSFCPVNYSPDFQAFSRRVLERIRAVQQQPLLEDEAGRDDYLYLSSIPWISFSSVQHAMHYSPADSVPRIAWGKFYEEGGKVWMPLSVQAHHALVDGLHAGRYFEKIQHLLFQPEQFL